MKTFLGLSVLLFGLAGRSELPAPCRLLLDTPHIQRYIEEEQHLRCKESLESHRFFIQLPLITSLFQQLENNFRQVEYGVTSHDWLTRAYLADAIDTLVENTDLPFLTKGPPPPTSLSNEQCFQVIDFDKHPSVNADNLSELWVREASNHSDLIREITTEGSLLSFVTFSAVLRKLTAAAGFAMRLSYNNQELAKLSLKLGINSIEPFFLPSAETTQKGTWHYHGPHYLFGKHIHEYTDANSWFARDLTPPARKHVLEKVHQMEKELYSQGFGLNDSPEVSQYVIANSDSRIRYLRLTKGNLHLPQYVLGKVLSKEAYEIAQQRGENPAYYQQSGHYPFSIKNLFGREQTSSMDIISPASVKNFREMKEELINNSHELSYELASLPLYKHSSIIEKKRKVLQTARVRTLLLYAQQELSSAIYRALDRRGAIQINHRLAPGDLHNYVSPVNGTALSHLEAVRFLMLLAQSLPTQKKNLEIRHLKILEAIFEAQENLLGRPSQPTLDFFGSNYSVAEPAVMNKPEILSQNDRKIMLIKHPNGSFSVHAFIGATGVNRVDVSPLSNIYHPLGSRLGDMQFGTDTYDETWNNKQYFFASKEKTTRDGNLKLEQGKLIGKESLAGSTVISFLLPTDYFLLPSLAEFKDAVEPSVCPDIELKVQMGTPLLIKTSTLIEQMLQPSERAKFAQTGAPGSLYLRDYLEELHKQPKEQLSKEEAALLDQLKP